MSNTTAIDQDAIEDEIPAAVLTAAPGEVLVLQDNCHRAELNVWRDSDIIGVIHDETAAKLNRGAFAAWSNKCTNPGGVVGFYATKDEAAAAIIALYEPTEELFVRTFSATSKHRPHPTKGYRTRCGHGWHLASLYIGDNGTVRRPERWMVVDLPECGGCAKSHAAAQR